MGQEETAKYIIPPVFSCSDQLVLHGYFPREIEAAWKDEGEVGF